MAADTFYQRLIHQLVPNIKIKFIEKQREIFHAAPQTSELM
ncbi:MAG TPA: hypothetical protein PKW15_07335 [Alphaproteobacteria bacterium]|nr:hypothetical protein [Alphaproteobacteria bacterium]